MVDVRSLTSSLNRGDTPSEKNQDNETKKSKRGGRRVNRNESFEDLFSGNAFEDDKVRPPDDEFSLNSSQISFQAPFSSSTSNLEGKGRSHFCGESDDEMSGEEDPFANSPKRRGARKKHHHDIEYDAGSVDFNDGDFDFTHDTTDEQALEVQDSEASFSWSKPEGEARQHELANEFNSTIGKSSLRKEKKSIPLLTVITATSGSGSPVSSIASSSIVSRQKKIEDKKVYKGSSTTSPTSALDIDAVEGEHRLLPPTIDTNTPEGVAGNYVMGPSRSRAQSRSRATSRGCNPRAASRSRSRVRGGELRSSLTKKEEGFQPIFPDSVDPEVEEDLFAGKEAAERSARSKTRDPGSFSMSHSKGPSVDHSSSSRSRSKSRSRDSKLEPSSFSRSRSKSHARDSEPENSSSRARSKSRARDSELESSSSRARSKSRTRESEPESSSSPRSKSRSRKSTKTDDSATEASPKKVTRVRIKAKGGGKLDPATAKRLIAEKMKQLKDSGDTSESASALEAMKDLFIVETKDGESANFSQSIRLDESSNNIDLGLDEVVEEITKVKKQKKKSKEVGDKTKSRKHRNKDSSENHDSFTDSVLSKSNSSLNASSRFEESFQVSADLNSAFNASMKLTTHEEESGDRTERKSRTRSKSPEKKHRPRGRKESLVKKSKEHNSESKDKERPGRSRSPTKKHRERSESPHKRSKEGHTRSKSPSKTSKEARARSKSRGRAPKE